MSNKIKISNFNKELISKIIIFKQIIIILTNQIIPVIKINWAKIIQQLIDNKF